MTAPGRRESANLRQRCKNEVHSQGAGPNGEAASRVAPRPTRGSLRPDHAAKASLATAPALPTATNRIDPDSTLGVIFRVRQNVQE
jgi:hypothetical protein